MFRKKRQKEREYAFMLLDGIEQGLWERAQSGPSVDAEGHAQLMANNVSSLLGASGTRRDPATLTELVMEWGEARGQQWEEEGDEARSDFVSRLSIDLGMNCIGNMFGFIPKEAPAYDPVLAAEGQRRGWRKYSKDE